MLDYERLLVEAVAQDTASVPRYLMSPQSDMGLNWFISNTAKKFVSAVAELSILDAPISASSILLYRDSELGAFTAEEVSEIVAIWSSAKSSEKIDVASLVRNIKSDSIRRRADESISYYRESVIKEPQKVTQHLDVLGGKIAMISHSGVEYDATPSKHLDEPTMSMRGNWGNNNVLDKMFSRSNTQESGGKPAYGLAIASMPTGHGKTSLANTLAAYSLAYSDDKVVIMSNEIVRSIYAGTIFNALKGMYLGDETDERLKQMMDDRLTIYAPSSVREHKGISVNSFELMRKILYWEKPQLAIMDSLNGVAAPAWASKMSENKAHEMKADAFRDTCLEFNLLMYAPGNMSEEHQKVLKSNKPDKLQSVMLFGSTAYQNASDWCFLGWRDYTQHGIVNIKRTKNRHGNSLGERWQMQYNFDSGIYNAPQQSRMIEL